MALKPNFPIIQSGDPLNRGLLAAWLFCEGGGATTVHDASKFNNTGTFVGPPTWTTGTHGKALNFDGTSQYINVSPLQAFLNTSEGTISLWFNQNSSTVIRELVDFRVDGNNEIEITQGNGQFGITFRCNYSAGGTAKTVSTSGLTNNIWYHVVMTWSKSADQVKLYLNGAQV